MPNNLVMEFALACFRLFWRMDTCNKSCQIKGRSIKKQPNPLTTNQHSILRNQFNEEEY